MDTRRTKTYRDGESNYCMKMIRISFNRIVFYQTGGMQKKLLSDMLDLLPVDASIMGFGCDISTNVDYIFVHSDQFAETPEGQTIPDATVFFSKDPITGTVTVDKIDYSNVILPVGSQCIHQWETYTGLVKTETYCKSCGIKK